MSNEQLRRENDVLKTDNTQLRTENDAMKDEIGQLATLLDKMAVNNENQMQQINSQSSEIAQLKTENEQLKVSQYSQGSHELFTYSIPIIYTLCFYRVIAKGHQLLPNLIHSS